jgi:hypothetical protein
MRSLEDWKQKKEEYALYLKSPKWNTKRKEIFKDRNGHCERCKIDVSKIIYQVHHKTYKNIFNEPNEDLELLCKPCHEKEHGITKKSKKQKPIKKNTITKDFNSVVTKNHNRNKRKLEKKLISGKITELDYNIKIKQANNRFKAKILNSYKLLKI